MRNYWKQMVVLILALTMLAGCSKGYPSSRKERDLTDQLSREVLDNMAQMDAMQTYYLEGLDACYQYVSGELEEASWDDALEAATQKLSQRTGVTISQELLDACQDSPFSPTELQVLPELVTIFMSQAPNRLLFLQEFIEINIEMDPLCCKLLLDLYQETAQEELLAFWYASIEFFSPITEESVLGAFCEDVRKLPNFQEIAADVPAAKEEAFRLQEHHIHQMENLQDQMALLSGQMQGDINAYHEELMQVLVEDLGLSQERAQAYIETLQRIVSKEQLLEIQKQELAEKKQELEILREEMRTKFAPLSEDEPGILWGKAKHFASVGMYEEAAMCLQVLKAQEDSDFSPECCEAGIFFFRNAPQMGYAYGVIILSPPPEGDLEPYQVGDVLVSIEGEPVYTVESYSTLRETYPEGYQVQILRKSPQGILELMDLTVPSGVQFYYIDLVKNAGQNAQ